MGKRSNQSGQAIIEYVIMLAIVLSVSGVIQFGMTRSRNKLWKKIICEVSAPCPGCASPESAKNTLRSGGECER